MGELPKAFVAWTARHRESKLGSVRRRGLGGAIFIATAGLSFLSRGEVAADSRAPPDAGSRCVLDIAGATYAWMGCTVATTNARYRDDDGGAKQRLTMLIDGDVSSPSVEVSLSIYGVPKVGPSGHFVLIAYVKKEPATWRVIAYGGGAGVTGTCDLVIDEVRKVVVDGGTSYEVHGSFVATLPEITGVRGPDVVLSGRF